MGVDLRLLVVDGNCGTWGFSHTLLSLHRDYELWEEIKKQEPQLRPAFSLSTFAGKTIESGDYEGEKTYGTVTEDPYGEPIRYLTASQVGAAVAAWERSSPNQGRLSKLNLACGAFMRLLHPETLVGLYWH